MGTMLDASVLRSKIVLSLMSALASAGACKAPADADPPERPGVTTTPTAANPTTANCGEAEPVRSCFEPHKDLRMGNQMGPPVEQPPANFDANGCQAMAEAEDGCCNPAAAGPFFDGKQCCYEFCASGCCGRPMLVHGAPRLAPVVRSTQWGGHRSEMILGEEDARALRDAWLADALMEHASVAAFARFSLQLLAVGAPPSLVRACHEAALDEVEHARLCFALASRFGGEPVGPGPLDIDGALDAIDLESVVLSTFVEGCVGETIAARMASVQHDVARDEEVRTTLQRIATDEAAHAELAWRFVAWAFTQMSAGDRSRVGYRLVQLAAAQPDGSGEVARTSVASREHGLLSASERREVIGETLEHVVRPALTALMNQTVTEDSAPRTVV